MAGKWYSMRRSKNDSQKTKKRKRRNRLDARLIGLSWNDKRWTDRKRRTFAAANKTVLWAHSQSRNDEHLGYKKHDNAGDHSGNSCNGHSEKTVILNDNSTIEIHVPRDRNSKFEPMIIPKHEKRTPLFNDQIISMYSYGMSCPDIQRHLQEVYGVNVSAELIPHVTEAAMLDTQVYLRQLSYAASLTIKFS